MKADCTPWVRVVVQLSAVTTVIDLAHYPAQAQNGTIFGINPALLVNDPRYDKIFLDADRFGGPSFPNIINPDEYPTQCNLMKEMVNCLQSCMHGYKSMFRGLVGALMPTLHQLPGQTPPKISDKNQAFPRIAPALEHIGNNLDEDVRVEEMAEICHLSLAHFRRLFNDAMGESPKQYLNRFRIHHAAAMLQTESRTVIDIALSCGYQSLSSFNRQFRNIMNCSPREWRQRRRPK